MDQKYIRLAKQIADLISKKVLEENKTNFHKFGNNICLGADGTVTKYIDKFAEDIAIDKIKKSKIKVNILSEEAGFIDNKAKYTFILDPVDGTRNCYRGIPFYSASIAIGKKSISDIEYGIVKNIPTGDVFTAEKGHGAFLNNKQFVVPDVPDKEILTSLALGKNHDKVTMKLAKKDKVRSLGSASLEMCLVGTGGLDYFVCGKEYLRVVDIAASTLILREAGGFVKNIKGEDLDMPFDLVSRTSVIATCTMDIVKDFII